MAWMKSWSTTASRRDRTFFRNDDMAIIDRITVKNGHLWIKESARVGMYWLRRRFDDGHCWRMQ